MTSLKRVRGIALIQVLIISIILTMLGIYINQTVRSQIGIVSIMKDSFQQRLTLENTEAELLQTLLTNKLYQKFDSDIPLVKQWNFYGKPFVFNENALVSIQDLSSLISINVTDNTIATKVFAQLGFEGHEVRTLLDSLADWKDKDDLKRLNGAEKNYYGSLKQEGPRNAYLQTLDEVFHVKQGELLNKEQWQHYFTSEVVSGFNPLNAPDLILKAFIDNDSVFDEVLQQRGEGILTPLSFYQISGIEQGEYIRFSTGRLLKVTIVIKQQKIKLSKQFIVDLRPSSRSRAITISQLLWNQE